MPLEKNALRMHDDDDDDAKIGLKLFYFDEVFWYFSNHDLNYNECNPHEINTLDCTDTDRFFLN